MHARKSVTKVQEYRVRSGLSQMELAVRARVSPAIVIKLEKGDIVGRRVGILIAVAHALGVSVVEAFPALGARPVRPVDFSRPVKVPARPRRRLSAAEVDALDS